MTHYKKWNRHLPSSSDSQVHVGFGSHQLIFDTTLAGRAISWNYQGIELLGAAGSDPVEYGFYPMLPWAGRLADNSISVNGELIQQEINHQGWAIHGLSFDRPLTRWHIKENENSTTFSGEQSIPDWIVPLAVAFTWEIRSDSIETIIEVTPTGAESAKVVLGWHPWFNKSLGVGLPAKLKIDNAKLLIKLDALPTGDLADFDVNHSPFDDAIIVPDKTVILEWPKALQLRVTNSHEWFVIYTGNKDFVCIEPQTGAPNSLNGSFGESALTCSMSEPARMTTLWELYSLTD